MGKRLLISLMRLMQPAKTGRIDKSAASPVEQHPLAKESDLPPDDPLNELITKIMSQNEPRR